MRLKPRVTAKQAAETLGGVLNDLGNQRGGGRARPVSEYVSWVATAEYVLFPLFDDPSVVTGLHTMRYEAMLGLVGSPPGTSLPGLYPEIEYQYARLRELKNQLDTHLTLASRPGDVIVVYDTNSLMHYQPPNRIKWSEFVAEAKLVRVVVPLCVIAELDNKKYTGSDTMARRAKAAVKALREITDGTNAGRPARLVWPDTQADLGATLEMLVDEAGHQRRPQVDDEIIDRAVLLQGITGTPLRVLTSDMNMSLRAAAAGIKTAELPPEYLKDRSSAD